MGVAKKKRSVQLFLGLPPRSHRCKTTYLCTKCWEGAPPCCSEAMVGYLERVAGSGKDLKLVGERPKDQNEPCRSRNQGDRHLYLSPDGPPASWSPSFPNSCNRPCIQYSVFMRGPRIQPSPFYLSDGWWELVPSSATQNGTSHLPGWRIIDPGEKPCLY